MTKLFENDRAPSVSQAFRLARIALTPHTPLAGLAAGLAAKEATLNASMQACSDADDLVLSQAARIRYLDAQLGRTVIEIARAKRATITGAGPDQHPSFRALFPISPTKGMAGPPDEAQDNYVAIVEAGLELPDNATLKATYGAELAERKAALAAAEQKQVELEQAQAKADAKLELDLAAARVAFNDAQLDAGSIVKDEGLVASLFDFRKEPRQKKKEG